MNLNVILIVFITFSSNISARKLSTQEENKIFADYLKTYNVRVSLFEYNLRKTNFLERYYSIEEHNDQFASGEITYRLELNKYSHFSHEELIQKRLGYIYSPLDRFQSKVSQNLTQFARASPNSYDWRSVQGGPIVRPVQDQGNCGSCWAFASIGAIEGQMGIKKTKFDKLSEQEIIECVKYKNQLLGCNGGFDTAAYNHAKVNNGVTNSTNDAYVATTTGRTCNLSRPRTAGSAVSSWNVLPPKNEANIRDTLFNVGPLYIVYYVSNDFFNYAGGIYTDSKRKCPNHYPNHAVLVVGYGTENGIDYWIIKNSWGSTWGENGYFRLKRGVNLCGIDLNASYPVLV